MDEVRRKGGRPSAGAAKIIKITLGATADDWQWLELWQPGASVQSQFREMLERARKFWPQGPDAFGQVAKKQPKKRLPSAALKRFAEERGIRYEDAAAVALEEFFKTR